jgi:hypothetical protein
MAAFPTYMVLDKQMKGCIDSCSVRIHMTLQAGSSALPPLDVVVMAAVFAISSITSLHSYTNGSQREFGILEDTRKSYLSRDRTALAITITSHSLRHFERFLWIHKRPPIKRLLIFRAGAVRSWFDKSTVVLSTSNISLEAE